MIGVTIGIGEGWRECSQWAALRTQQMTGLQCATIEGSEYGDDFHPSWLKCQILDIFPQYDEFLYFDADIIPLKPWNPQEIFEKNGRKICAVRDNNPVMRVMVEMEEQAIGILKGTYLNAGLFMFGREHAPVFEATWARRPEWHNWIDQSAWNRSLYDLKVPVAVLPNRFNEMGWPNGSETINYHYHSLNGDWKALKKLQDKYPTPATAGTFRPAPPVPTT